MKHLADYQMIHRLNARYGSGPGAPDLPLLQNVIKKHLASVRTVIDYGCGNSKAIFTLWPRASLHCRYDFAHPDFTQSPPQGFRFDCGLCTDVMEHVPREELPLVFARMMELSSHWLFTIHTKPAGQKLMDGSNAHVTQLPAEEWKPLLEEGLQSQVTIWPTEQPFRFIALAAPQ